MNINGNQKIAYINPIRYRSYYWDRESGFYYLESRYYDSNTKRFINADDLSRINLKKMDTNLYAYCGGDPVNLYDPQGRALTAIDMFTVKEFKTEASDISYAICRTFDRTTTWNKKISNKTEDFITWWTGLGKRDLVIINTHADEEKLYINKDGTLLITKDAVNSFPKKADIKWLVLLGCNAGHFSYTDSIARFFSNRITGKVVASDGTVQTNLYFNILNSVISFTSKKDTTFDLLVEEADRPKRKNYGWLVFVGTAVRGGNARVYYLNGGTQKLTIKAICNLVDNAKSYFSYK